MTVAALITAGGIGTRMATAVPKQYLDLCGLPILVRTLRAFQDNPLVDRIVLTVPAGEEDYCRRKMVEPYQFSKPIAIVTGGPTRQESVFNGLKEVFDAAVVAIHDGVRPLISQDTITRTIEAARAGGAAVACVAVTETVKKRIGQYLTTIPRSDLWIAHTPQTFRTALIVQAHQLAYEQGFEATDDAMLVEWIGHPVTVVEDSDENLKITTPHDLARAEMILHMREAKHCSQLHPATT
ncbi:MAG: 2-C-methyl-D-erythritol 4-phosphate cytidylyltransferase [Desulfomonile sp.]|nr:2-C-methyl-D-erythritol 4-phosphate cytidylyltransferase [Desulfomonile sp.]